MGSLLPNLLSNKNNYSRVTIIVPNLSEPVATLRFLHTHGFLSTPTLAESTAHNPTIHLQPTHTQPLNRRLVPLGQVEYVQHWPVGGVSLKVLNSAAAAARSDEPIRGANTWATSNQPQPTTSSQPTTPITNSNHNRQPTAITTKHSHNQQQSSGRSVRDPHNMDYTPTRWPESPRIVTRCAPRAPNGPDHLR